MIIKIYQQNIFKGKYLDKIIDFVKKEQVDICLFQEVAGGSFAFSQKSDFLAFKNALNYQGEQTKTVNPVSDPDSYFGEATFFNDKFKLLKKEVIWLKGYDPNFILGRAFASTPRAALALKLEVNGKQISFINAHMARGPDPYDAQYKLMQAQRLIRYIKKLENGFVLTGDFNVVSDTKLVKRFEKLGKNLTKQFNVKYTLNPKEHFLKDEVIKNNLAIDFVFISEQIKVKTFKLVKENLSDHYGILVKLEV